MEYTNPNCLVNRLVLHPVAAGATSGATYARYKHYRQCRVVGAQLYIATAGTANEVLTIRKGTTSIGTFAPSTSAAGNWVDGVISNTTHSCSSGEEINVTNGADTVIRANVLYRLQDLPG